MTPTDAARQLLELAEQATPGPWEWVIPEGVNDLGYEGPMPKIKADNCDVCDFGDSTTYYPTEGCEPSNADQELIAHARNHGPTIARALLDAEERERCYRSAIINVIERYHISTSAINILQSALDQDEATGKAGG